MTLNGNIENSVRLFCKKLLSSTLDDDGSDTGFPWLAVQGVRAATEVYTY